MDVVYVVRAGEDNEPLRYSLRSLAANLPHGRVWIAGHMPTWVRDVEYIPTDQYSAKWNNSHANMRAAASHPDVSEEFLLFNDDFFVTAPQPDGMPVYHGGDLAAWIDRWPRPGKYIDGAREVLRMLGDLGVADPVCYDLHLPMQLHKAQFLEEAERAATMRSPAVTALWSRTFYGNRVALGGREVPDCKVAYEDQPWPGYGFVSTAPPTWKAALGEHLRETFAEACRYEDGYVDDTEPEPEAEPVPLPSTRAPKRDWVALAVARGHDQAHVESLTKPQLITMLGG